MTAAIIRRPRLVKQYAEPSVVRMLREACAKAERGEIKAVGLVTVHNDGSSGTAWAHAPDTYGRLVGASSQLNYRLNKDWV